MDERGIVMAPALVILLCVAVFTLLADTNRHKESHEIQISMADSISLPYWVPEVTNAGK